jgi:hypothetical protein
MHLVSGQVAVLLCFGDNNAEGYTRGGTGVRGGLPVDSPALSLKIFVTITNLRRIMFRPPRRIHEPPFPTS